MGLRAVYSGSGTSRLCRVAGRAENARAHRPYAPDRQAATQLTMDERNRGMREAVIVSGARTAVGRAHKGSLRTVRPDDMAATVIRAAVDRAVGLDPNEIEDVILGCALPEAEQGLNVARVAATRAGLPHSVP